MPEFLARAHCVSGNFHTDLFYMDLPAWGFYVFACDLAD
jgi:hypothetical protein